MAGAYVSVSATYHYKHWQSYAFDFIFKTLHFEVCFNRLGFWLDRLCGLVVRVSGYRSRGPGFYSRSYQIFWEVVGLERGPLSLARIIEELLEWKSSGSGLENRY
jgi:hypothetical protein